MCAQRLLCRQALADRRLSLGVLYGLKSLYRQHGLPPCVVGDALSWSSSRMEAPEMALA
jgi:hypothetical protein